MPAKNGDTRRATDAKSHDRTERKRVTINMDKATAALWEQARERHGGALDAMRALLAVDCDLARSDDGDG